MLLLDLFCYILKIYTYLCSALYALLHNSLQF